MNLCKRCLFSFPKKANQIFHKLTVATLGATLSFAAINVTPAQAVSLFINEIHYDNAGTDKNEGIELAGFAGTNLIGWSLVLYDGGQGKAYNTKNLTGIIPNQQNGFGTLFFSYPTNGIQNGGKDGIALVNKLQEVVQFLSYEGILTALDSPAKGLTSIGIGVEETNTTPLGFSLQLTGTGNRYEDFTWNAAALNTYNNVNTGQTFTSATPDSQSVPEPSVVLGLCLLGFSGLLKKKFAS